MSARKSDAKRASDVIEAIDEARARVALFNLTEESFLETDDVTTRAIADSLLMCVLRATEEAGKLSQATQHIHPEIDWRGITGMRNYLAHDYGNIDRSMVWAAVHEEFDTLRVACEQVIEEADDIT